jgi:ABC-type glycerol-3-phosphate transport system substrate-binding protein
MRRALAAGAAVLVVAGCGGGEEPADQEAADVPAYEVVKDEGRTTELLSEGVDTAGAEAIINQVIAEDSGTWEGEHNVQVVAEPDAGTVVCRARWVEDEESSALLTGGSVTSEDGEWPAVEMNCFE